MNRYTLSELQGYLEALYHSSPEDQNVTIPHLLLAELAQAFSAMIVSTYNASIIQKALSTLLLFSLVANVSLLTIMFHFLSSK